MTNTKQTGKFMLGTLIGGMIGGITALLLAPRPGEETQQMIIEKREDLRQEAEKRIDEGRMYTKDKIDETRNTVSEWLSSGRELLDQASSEIKVESSKKSNSAEKQKTAA